MLHILQDIYKRKVLLSMVWETVAILLVAGIELFPIYHKVSLPLFTYLSLLLATSFSLVDATLCAYCNVMEVTGESRDSELLEPIG